MVTLRNVFPAIVILLSTFLSSIHGSVDDDFHELQAPCPLNWDSNPCECTGHARSRTIDCSRAQTPHQLSEVFGTLRPGLPFNTLKIIGSNITSLPRGLFIDTNFTNFLISDCQGLSNIPEDLFASSIGTLKSITISKTKLTSFPFSILNGYPALERISLSHNELSTIPANAFGIEGLSRLQELDLSGNQITDITPMAFTHLPYLYKLDLSNNNMTTIDGNTFSMPDQQETVLIWLSSNSISEIKKDAFANVRFSSIHLEKNRLETLDERTFGPYLEYLERTDSSFQVEGNPFVCNETLRWIIDKPRGTRQHFKGFTCSDGTMLENLTPSDLHNKPKMS